MGSGHFVFLWFGAVCLSSIRAFVFTYGICNSIRINQQYRVCFRWEDGYADEVEVTGYR